MLCCVLTVSASQPGRDYTKPHLSYCVNSSSTAQGSRPDGGDLVREVKAYLEKNLGIPVGSFDVDHRLPAKDKEVIMEVGKLFALCPKEGMVTGLRRKDSIIHSSPCSLS